MTNEQKKQFKKQFLSSLHGMLQEQTNRTVLTQVVSTGLFNTIASDFDTLLNKFVEDSPQADGIEEVLE